jgi:hypothetical protein
MAYDLYLPVNFLPMKRIRVVGMIQYEKCFDSSIGEDATDDREH